MVTIEQEILIDKADVVDVRLATHEELLIEALLDKVDELEREIAQLREMIKR